MPAAHTSFTCSNEEDLNPFLRNRDLGGWRGSAARTSLSERILQRKPSNILGDSLSDKQAEGFASSVSPHSLTFTWHVVALVLAQNLAFALRVLNAEAASFVASLPSHMIAFLPAPGEEGLP